MENNNAVWEEGYVLASDVWRVGKSLTPMSGEEELEAWEQAVSVLHDFGKVAETLRNDPLLLALTDAKDRAQEELARVQDRLSRPEGAKISPPERERLQEMWKRSNAISNAWVLMVTKDNEERLDHAEDLAILEAMRDEVNEALYRYRAECGFPGGL